MNRLQRLLRPRSIAVFGGYFAEAVIRQCDRMGYDGEIWPVHPEREQILNRPCVRRAEDLPAAPDAAFVGINRNATIGIVQALANMDTAGAVCYASGFKEVGDEGVELQEQLIAAAGDMPILGPNCYGFINYLDGALLWPDVHGGKRIDHGVALISQSSNVGINLTMSQRGVPLAYMVTVGNQAVVGLHEIVRALCDDDRVTAIGMYVEGISDGQAFSSAIHYAHAKGVPVVVLKTGQTHAATELALSHTASLSGVDAVIDEYFKRLGIARIHSIPVLLETLKILHVTGPLSGRDIVSMSCSGGEASIMSDTAKDKDVCFRSFTEADKSRIKETVNPLVNVSNPFDYHTFDWGKGERLEKTFTAVMQSGFDLTCLVLDFPRPDAGSLAQWDLAWQALANAANKTESKAAVVATLPECLPEAECERLIKASIVPLHGVDEALSAIEAAVFSGQHSPQEVILAPPTKGSPSNLNEWQAKKLLSEYGIAVPEHAYCRTVEDALDLWRRVKQPIVMKAIGGTLLHKTETEAVILNLESERAIDQAYKKLVDKGDGGVLAEVMIRDGIAELIVGAARDPVVGLHLLVGVGGIFTEVVKDSMIILLPTEREEIEQAINGLYLAPILKGWRGGPVANVDGVIDTVLRVQAFVQAHIDALHELDINPLIVNREGAVAVDAMIRLSR
ncbi:MAG: acetate--CoA ligase family protein [Arenicellales bacterium]|nr:acetate--CoA ligase family protein [Arenicellales bacterium]